MACALLLGACAAGSPAVRPPADRWLSPVFGITGGILTDKIDPTGFPLPGGKELHVPFRFPVAVVESLGSIYIADAGFGRVFRYERTSGLMHAIPDISVAAGTTMRVGGDGSLYLLDAMGGEIRRYATNGRPLPALHGRVPGSRYRDFVINPANGQAFAVDVQWRVIDQIASFGRIAVAHLDLSETGPIALDGDVLYVADARCKCVNEWRDGRLVRQLAAGQIRLPRALVAESGELYLLDGFDRSISRVFHGGLETLRASDLGLIAPEQIFVAQGMLYVADGASRSVAAFRIRR